MEKILGTFSFSLTYKEKNGYSVNIYKLNNQKKVTIVGFYLPTNKLTYEFTGDYIIHEKYGEQFKAESFREYVENTKDSIVAYLSAGIIKGIGKKTAERIWEMFGENTMDIIENDSEKLLKVKGISVSKLKDIRESCKTINSKRDLLSLLLPYGIPAGTILKLQEEGNLTEKIKNNPYILADFPGIGFETADRVGQKMGICAEDERRIEACMIYCLKSSEINGCLSMDKDEFGQTVLKMLGISCEHSKKICDKTISMIKEKKLIYKHIKDERGKEHYQIFLPSRYNVEVEIAKRLIEIKNQPKENYNDIDRKLEDICRQIGIEPDESQIAAVKMTLREPISVIAGGPGSGKTTTENIIISFLEMERIGEICLMAPTGRASRRMAEVTGREASTIHSRLKIYDTSKEIGDIDEEEGFYGGETIIVDEFSMVDIWVMNRIMKAIGEGCKFILVGDPNQLPSVGPGAVLRDIILSGVLPVSTLKKVHRQSEDSVIYENCELIGDGITKLLEGNDFHYYKIPDIKKLEDMMVADTVHYVKKYGQENVICLCPYKDYPAGVHRMNSRLQEILNPAAKNKDEVIVGEIVYRVGDIVMHLKNQQEASNGDIGFVEKIYVNDDNQQVICVRYADCHLEYLPDDYRKNLQLAYASTIHKVQGCEYKAVVSCLCKHQKKARKRKILFTSISRGKIEESLYTDDASVIEEAIKNVGDDDRGTLLWWHLRYLDGQFV